MNETAYECSVCPFECKADRETRFGVCRLPNRLLISHAQPHFYEEPSISGESQVPSLKGPLQAQGETDDSSQVFLLNQKLPLELPEPTRGGSGAVFFTGCNGRCMFCQNFKISQPEFWKFSTSIAEGEEGLLYVCETLLGEGVKNLNFVSPTPYSKLLADFLAKHKKKLPVPIVWNSNGYEKAETLKKLEGLVDVYLPDLKYFDDALALRYSGFRDYFHHATSAIQEMFRQVGFPQIGGDGYIRKGLIVRHMVLPGQVEDSKKVLDWIRETLGPKAHVSLMAQYFPTYKADQYPEVKRRLTPAEYDSISDYFMNLGFEDGLVQDLESADPSFTPEFL
jgi:putative pyruvate formate lyase activating enzyme